MERSSQLKIDALDYIPWKKVIKDPQLSLLVKNALSVDEEDDLIKVLSSKEINKAEKMSIPYN